MQNVSDYRGWTISVWSRQSHFEAFSADATIKRGDREYRFHEMGSSDSEVAAIQWTVPWLRHWIDVNVP
ncbi:hypothetical protein ACQUFY_05735 [Robbsia andropogonis]|uniref:hypothetical protein n=1 Tax=Robbsia andropogonis TaxID=28092 RepID=UPI003D20F3EC